MEIILENIREGRDGDIKSFIHTCARRVYREDRNPVKKVIVTGEIERHILNSLESREEKRLWTKSNREKSLVTRGKNIPVVRDGSLEFTIILDSYLLWFPERFQGTLIHEMIHSLDYSLYFENVSPHPYKQCAVLSPDDYHPEYSCWSEYNANRASQRALNRLRFASYLDTYDLNGILAVLVDKLKKARYHETTQLRRNFVADVAFSDFNQSFLMYAGKSAELSEYRDMLDAFLIDPLAVGIFRDSLRPVVRLLDTMYDMGTLEKRMTMLPKMRYLYAEIIAGLNHFSLHASY
ncbi:MAG: hypothetical protein JXD19_08390 [Deltaproteobacteria bacterium]|nr:hypothetical protein [Deltaproteobacteria bacterium]